MKLPFQKISFKNFIYIVNLKKKDGLQGGVIVKLTTRDMTQTALFAALTAVAAIIVRVGGPAVVPFSLVPFVVMLAGGILGPRLGALSILVYVLVGLVGVPVFASAPFGGISYVLVPTFGFLLGFIVAAFVIGMLIHGKEQPSNARYAVAMLVGIAIMYIIGLPYLYVILNLYMGKGLPVAQIITIGFTPYIAFDLIKGVLAIIVTKAVLQRLPRHQ